MKKLIILFMLFTIPILSQELTISSFNSTTTALDSAGVFTGTVEETGFYSYLTIIIKSDRASATNGLRVMFGKTSTVFEHNYFFSYSAADTLTNKITLPITGGYFKIVYTNTTTAQTTFSLTTYMHKQAMLPFTSEGKLSVADATVEMTLTNIEADADSTVDMVTLMDASLNNIEADADSTVDMVTAIHADVDTVEEKLDSLDASSTRIESKLDDANVGIDSLDASSTRIEGYVDGVEAKLDTIEVSINATNLALVEMNNGIDSLDAVNTRSEVLLTDIKSSLTSYARYFGAINNDTTSATDTVTFGSATSWAKFTLDAVADTLEWSLDGTNWHSLLPVQSFTTPEKLNITYFSEIYIKPRNVGTITYSYVWIAY